MGTLSRFFILNELGLVSILIATTRTPNAASKSLITKITILCLPNKNPAVLPHLPESNG